MTQPKEQWEIDFDKEFTHLGFCKGNRQCSCAHKEIKAFFHSTREEARKEGFLMCKERIIAMLPKEQGIKDSDFENGYDTALSSVKTLIENLEI